MVNETREPRSSHVSQRRLVLGAAAVLIILAAGGAWYYLPPDQRPPLDVLKGQVLSLTKTLLNTPILSAPAVPASPASPAAGRASPSTAADDNSLLSK